MAPMSVRPGLSVPSAHRRLAAFARPRCEQLEHRVTPALFDVLTPLSFTGLNNNGCVAVADFDKNGFADAVLTNFGTDHSTGAGDSITVLYGKAGGGFNRVQLPTLGKNVSFASVADINGDTWPDVVVANANQQNTGSITVFKNENGNLSRQGNPFLAGGNNTSWVGMADVTGDNILDVIVASFGKDDGSGEDIVGNNVTIFQGNADAQGKGNFTFSASPITTLAPEVQFVPTALAIADFDGDGLKDITAVSPGVPPDFGQPYPNGTVYAFKGTGSGGFATPTQYDAAGVFPVNIQAGDLNGDGKADLVVANAGDPNANPEFTGDSVGVLLNVSSGGNVSFGVPNSLTTNTYGTFAVAITDFNLDNKADIAAVNYGAQTASSPAAFVSVYMGNGSGTFTPGSPGTYDTKTAVGGGQYLAIGDFDADTVPDLIVTHASNLVGVLINTSEAVPSVTINQGASQADPTNGGSIVFDVVFSEGVTGFTGSDIDLSASSLGGLSASVAAIDASKYTVTVTGMSGTGTVVAKIPAGAATSVTGSVASLASTSSDNTVTFDSVAPTVTINQAAGQADPASAGPIQFTVAFSESVTGFTASDVSFAGSTVGGTLQASVSGSGANYTVLVTGMAGNGTVVASLPAGGANDPAGNKSAAGTFTDNTVSFDSLAPSVTINQAAGQADSTSDPSVKFDVKFAEAATGFDPADVSLAGSTVGGTLSVFVNGSLDTYEVTVTGMTSPGVVIASIPAGGATDLAGNKNLASTSEDNSVEFTGNVGVGFSQAVFATTEDDVPHSVTITVTRSGLTGGAVSIDYTASDGSAHNGGSPTFGQADYTPVSGTLRWADGEGGDKTFTIPILPDALNEGKELINLSLTNPVGDPVLGRTSAKVAIAPSDGQGPGLYLDQDDDRVRLRLKGKTGSMEFFRTDPDGDGKGPIELIRLTDTLPNPLRPRASLVIGVTKSKNSADGGTVGLGAITGDGLRSIIAPRANLNLEGIDLDGYLGALSIGNILGGADILTLATSNARQKTRISALTISDGTTIDVDSAISVVRAVRIGKGEILAPSIGTMVVRGQPRFGVPGDMASDITLSGTGLVAGQRALGGLVVKGSIPADVDIVAPSARRIFVRKELAGDITITGEGVDPARNALGGLRVVGPVTSSDISVNGNVGAVVVGAFRDSRLFAGYSGADDGSGGFNLAATVTTFRATARLHGFQDSRVIATHIRSATITNLDPTNPGEKFGFYADTSVGTLTVLSPTRFVFDPTLLAPQGVGDFEVRIV